jgi:hypothetical protein
MKAGQQFGSLYVTAGPNERIPYDVFKDYTNIIDADPYLVLTRRRAGRHDDVR